MKGNISTAFVNRRLIIQKPPPLISEGPRLPEAYGVCLCVSGMCVCMRVCPLLCDIFMSDVRFLLSQRPICNNRQTAGGNNLLKVVFLQHDFCSFPAATAPRLSTERPMPVITANTVICHVSRHDGYLRAGHLSFPLSQALPPSVLPLSFWRGLLVICPA